MGMITRHLSLTTVDHLVLSDRGQTTGGSQMPVGAFRSDQIQLLYIKELVVISNLGSDCKNNLTDLIKKQSLSWPHNRARSMSLVGFEQTAPADADLDFDAVPAEDLNLAKLILSLQTKSSMRERTVCTH